MRHFWPSIGNIFLVLVSVAVGGCAAFSGVREVPISETAKMRLRNSVNDSRIPITLVHRDTDNAVTFLAAFDGTMNDRLNTPADEDTTIVAKLYEAITAPDVAFADTASSPIAKHYEKGPGCSFGFKCWFDAATGYSSETTADRMLDALRQFIANKPRDIELHVVVIGFSRGAATARHFLNHVYEAGKSGFLHDAGLSTWSYAILFDTVATGQESALKLGLPSNTELAIHYVARNEARTLFAPIVDADPYFERFAELNGVFPARRVWTIEVPGAHSDLGDSYQSGAGALITANATRALMEMGLVKPGYIELCPQGDKSAPNYHCRSLDEGLHDSRGVFDRLLGSPSPFACGFRRPLSHTAAGNMSQEEAFQLADRLRRRRAYDLSVGRGTGLGTRSTESYVFQAVYGAARWDVLWPKVAGYVGSAALISWGMDKVELAFTDPYNNGKSVSIPKAVLDELWHHEGRAKIELNLTKPSGPWWFVDECLPSER